MEDNTNLVTDVTENVEVTTEETQGQVTEIVKEPEKLYSEADLNNKINELLPKKLARREAKIRKEYESKYGRVENVLKSGLGVESIEEATSQLADFYTKKGIKIPETPTYSDRDMQVLAKAEADEIIASGFDEVVEEVDRLAELGVENMTTRDREVFKKLAEYRQVTERQKELSKIGVKEDFLENKEFKDFASKFNANTPIKDIYDLYVKTQPKQKFEQVGSMKNAQADKTKDYYSPEEIQRMTLDDLNDPDVWNAVRKSMTGQN